MVKNLLVFFSVILAVTAIGQSRDEELISWSAYKKLTWADYKGTPRPESDAVASTATYLGIEYSFNNKGFGYKITCTFSKNRSWGSHKTDYVLAHEQGHFDIAEIFARKLNWRMSEYRFNKNSFKTDLKKIYDEITRAKEAMQNEYDKETNHSIKKEKQEEWLKKIQEELNEYKDFADYQ